MANQSFSAAEDLMVGAGELYFKRKDDPNGFHHLGNAESFNITTDVTTVEKNSSMNKRRELMASVVTAVAPSASITLNEYNPYNLALGLFGEEHLHTQEELTLTDESYAVDSVPGIIEVKDADGNRVYKLHDVSLKLAIAKPASMNPAVGQILISGKGTTNVKVSGTYTGLTDKTYYIWVSHDVTTAGDVAGLKFKYGTTPVIGSAQTVSPTTGTGTTDTVTIADGIVLDVTIEATTGDFSNVSPSQFYKIECKASSSDLKEGVDYLIEEQSSRAGFIKIMDTPNIEKGDMVLVTAKASEASLITVSGGSAGEIEGELMFIGDPNQGDVYVIEAWDVKVQPDGDLTGLISDDFGSFDLTIKFLTDYQNHPEYPYYKVTKVGSASGTEVKTGKYDPRE